MDPRQQNPFVAPTAAPNNVPNPVPLQPRPSFTPPAQPAMTMERVRQQAPVQQQQQQPMPRQPLVNAAPPSPLPLQAQPIIPNPVPPTNMFAGVSAQPTQQSQVQPMFNQPIMPASPFPSASMRPSSKPRLNKKLLIWIGSGVALLAIVAVVLFVFILPGDTIRNIDQLKDALNNRKAINCTLTNNSQTVVIQTDDGWNNLRLKMGRANVLATRGEYIYTWYESNNYGNRITYNTSIFDSLSNSIPSGAELEDGATLDCKPSSQADFSMPSGIEF